ncbi:hypothetical protein yfred0001_1930 [Yersinia frederiksenii ATCC 33641]|nr:hypothetical protein yfred0001_1930 [Yersinia frederiksenii ATCC 33641]
MFTLLIYCHGVVICIHSAESLTDVSSSGLIYLPPGRTTH